MFGLLVSHDSGRTYRKDREAHSLDELRSRMTELDAQGSRWFLTRNGVEYPEVLCAVHRRTAQALAYFLEELAETVAR